ncbi:Sugar transport protein 13 [Heracleum sosnowskyi]|uniref:Sugar transport protein 13 n=1 Tax=Heracleum sosnowskyi TaxID=360622 RepID=A0AAD8NDY6_9APIA|nr:Sugar transport protein 13 [Heracleum sosnowskyi]
MAIGVLPSPDATELEEAKTTRLVVWSCLLASTGGLMFGYDLGISGGVTSMESFLKEFFPVVYKRTQQPGRETNYCKYNNQRLQLFTSSLYVAALVATFFASYTTKKHGRRFSMRIAGIFYLGGVVLNAAALNLPMLIFGRIALGCGLGFSNQSVPLYLSELAPTRIRGALNLLFQLMVTFGILFANLVNYWTSKMEGGWGWRLSLGLAGIPALLLTAGSLIVFETPNSLIERGKLEEGKLVLKKIRGISNVEPEFRELVDASRVAGEIENPFSHLVKKKNRPQLVIAVALQFFQQFTGMNAIMFYAPVLLQSLGFGDDASLYSAAITGGVNVLSTIISIYAVDKFGRRFLLLLGGILMLLAQIVITAILGAKLPDNTNNLDKLYSVVVVVTICIFVAAFACSWGPLGWLIPSETFPLETRSAGQSVTVCMNMLFTFIIAQSFLSMLCAFKYLIFMFFAVWLVVMTVFTWFFVPETTNVHIEKMKESVWNKQWLCMICHEEMQDLLTMV